MKTHYRNAGHMIKIADMPIYGKSTLKIFFPGIIGPILTKLGMMRQRPTPIIFCSNDNLG